MQDGHDDLRCGAAFLRVEVHGYPATVVGDGHRAVIVDDDVDVGAVAGKGFVDGVIDDLEHHVVEARSVVRVTDVHAGAGANGLESLEDTNVSGIVGRVRHRRV